MDNDFGLLVDYLRGELDERAGAAVRSRLEAEGPLFDAFVRLRRTFAVLRSMPALSGAGAAARSAYLADLQREFETRGWTDLLPGLQPSTAFLSMLRAEYSVRALLSCLPQLVPGPALIAALRARFGVGAVVASLPAIAARAAWVRALRHEFVVRATLETVPQLEPTAAFKRRLQVALFEAARESAPEPAAPLLPAMAAKDSFRRRLFRSLLQASGPRLNGRAFRIDLREYQFGRVLAGAWKRSRRPVAATMALHLIAVLVLFFVTVRVASVEPPTVAAIEGGKFLLPEQPGGNLGSSVQIPRMDARLIERPDDPPPPMDEPEQMGDGSSLPPAPPPEEVARPRPEMPQAIEPAARSETLAWFRLRPESKREKIRYLGSSELYEALELSLQWLRRYQDPEGFWGTVDATQPPVNPDLQTMQRVELTSAALLAFLGDGHSSKRSPPGLYYDLNVKRGIAWLLKQQQPDGRIGPADTPIVLSHAMATLALAEEYALTREWRTGAALRNACRWLSGVRPVDESGGFPYRAGQPPSLMTSVWAHMALATATRAGVPAADAPPQRIESLMGWFLTETRYDTPLTDAAAEVAAMSELLPTSGAAALACLQDETEGRQRLQDWLTHIGRTPPNIGDRLGDASDMRYMFLGSLAFANHADSAAAAKWQSAMSATLLSGQIKEGRHAGAFGPTSGYADIYGYVFSTAFAALSIENAWRVRVK